MHMLSQSGRARRRRNENAWDIGNIGAEPERAKTIAFTAAYAEIEATYLVPEAVPSNPYGT